jgi:xylulokinase
LINKFAHLLMYLIGFDIGSSSVKASLVEFGAASALCTVQSPEAEMEIHAAAVGWAEQDTELWWKNCCVATQKLLQKTAVLPTEIVAIGLSYQMHGLVLVDSKGKPLRPAIIWCDSRAVELGNAALRDLGDAYCYGHCLNGPGNFTASKLKWVKENEPHLFEKTWKMMLPGDYIAFRMTGEANTTVGGLSEGILWDFQENKPAQRLLDYYGISDAVLPDIVPTFGLHGKLSKQSALELGLAAGTAVTYRAGDQPNNALSLNVLLPGEVAATGGTSGVVYGVSDKLIGDEKGRVNSFAHVNHSAEEPKIGTLLCINGAGIQYSWVRKHVAGDGSPYTEMENLASSVPVGSEGLRVMPFGNGAERMFQNQNLGAQIQNLHFNLHGKAHIYRATLEGIAFSFVHGMKALEASGLDASVLRVGNDNLFQSKVFSQTI